MSPEDVSDAELIIRVRTGDLDAFGALYARHREPALRVARAITGDPHAAEDLVSAAFERIHGAVARGKGPADSFRAYLYTVIRRLASEEGEARARLEDTDDFRPYEAVTALSERPYQSVEAQLVVTAMSSLPARHQAVLWYLDVEGMTPQQAEPLFGLTPNATSALAVRARDSLRDAYLQAHVSLTAVRHECAPVRGLMGSYQRANLSARDTAKVEAHLAACSDCPVVLAELRDVSSRLRAILWPIVAGGSVLGLTTASVAGGTASTVSAATITSIGAAKRGKNTAKTANYIAVAVVSALALVASAAVVSAVARPSLGAEAAAPDSLARKGAAAISLARPNATPTPAITPESELTSEPEVEVKAEIAPEPVPIPEPEPAPPVAALGLELLDYEVLDDGRYRGAAIVTVRNGNDYEIDVDLDLKMPAGIDFADGISISTPWSCDGFEGTNVSCVARHVDPAAELVLELPVTISEEALGFRPAASMAITRTS